MTKSLLPATWQVPQVFRDRLGESVGRQRAMLAEGHLLLVLHAPPSDDSTQRTGRFFWRSPEGSWKSDQFGSGIGALQRHLAEFAERVEELDRAEEAAEGARVYFSVLRAIAPLHRTARNLHSALQQGREQVPDDRGLISCRDRAGTIERSAELLQMDAKNGLDFAMAIQAEQQARTSHELTVYSHRLNVLATTFFPIVTLASIFGMSLPSGLEGRVGPIFFWSVLAVGILSGLVLKSLLLRPPRS